MQREQSINRDIEGYKLTIVLTPKKIIIRALERDTNALYACQFKAGSLPQNIIFIYQNEENFFQALISEENIRISKDRLIIGYKVFRNNQAIQRQIAVPLIKMEIDQFESLQNRVNALEAQVEKISAIELELRHAREAIIMLQQRTNYYYFNPEVFKPLVFDISNNPSSYKLRQNYLNGKPRQSSNEILSLSLISNQPIDEEDKLFSYQVKVTDVQGTQGRVFIGLCAKKEKQANLLYQQNLVQPNNQAYSYIGKNCQIFSQLYRSNSGSFVEAKVGDEIVLTVNLQNCSMTWFKNKASLGRTYFERPTTNIYPFIYLKPNTEITI